MESLLNRYRNITVLLIVIFAQLVLLGYQVKNDQDMRLIRVWSVTAVTPLARALEWARSGTSRFLEDYILLHNAHEKSQRLQADLDRLKMENQFLRSELATADRAKALAAFQARTPSRTLAARVISTGAGYNSKVIFIDTGSHAGVKKGMAVVTPDGIVGKVLEAYPTASEVLLITDSDFAAGVISQKHRAKGVLKGQGYDTVKVDYIPSEEKVDVGEWFYTSGDDRIFPKGFPVGVVQAVRPGSPFKEIYVEPSGLQHGLEEVLVLLSTVHQPIPTEQPSNAPMYMAPPPPENEATPTASPTGLLTDADRLLEKYKEIGSAQGHVYGEGTPGSKPPNFNIKLPLPGASPNQAVPGVIPAGQAAKTGEPAARSGLSPKPAPEGISPSPRLPATPPQSGPSVHPHAAARSQQQPPPVPRP